MGFLNDAQAVEEEGAVEEAKARGRKPRLITDETPIHGFFDVSPNDWTNVVRGYYEDEKQGDYSGSNPGAEPFGRFEEHSGSSCARI
jgi:hypothetical protein